MLKHIDVHDEAYMICPHKPRLENIWQFCYMIGSSTDFRRHSLLVLWWSIGQSLWVKESFVSESDRQQKFAQIWNCLAFFGQFADIWHFVSLFMPKMVYKCHIFTKDIMRRQCECGNFQELFPYHKLCGCCHTRRFLFLNVLVSKQ